MGKSRLAVISAVLVALVAAAPVAADTSIREVGTVGPHRLIDTIDRPGMACQMSQLPSGYWIMDGISVKPPRMRGTRDSQRVAWQFIVERSATGPWNWEVVYRSPRQNATADIHTRARFSKMSVEVSGSEFYWYRVRVKMFWYGPAGLEGKATHGVDYYREGATGNVYGAPCGYDTSEPK